MLFFLWGFVSLLFGMFVFCLYFVCCCLFVVVVVYLLLFLMFLKQLLSTCLNDLYVRPLSCFIGTFPIELLLDLPSRD